MELFHIDNSNKKKKEKKKDNKNIITVFRSPHLLAAVRMAEMTFGDR